MKELNGNYGAFPNIAISSCQILDSAVSNSPMVGQRGVLLSNCPMVGHCCVQKSINSFNNIISICAIVKWQEEQLYCLKLSWRVYKHNFNDLLTLAKCCKILRILSDSLGIKILFYREVYNFLHPYLA